MATDELQVSIDLSPELLDRLKAYQPNRSLSQAVVAVLQEFFQQDCPHVPLDIAPQPWHDRVMKLEATVDILLEKVEQLSQAQSAPKPISTTPHFSSVDSSAAAALNKTSYSYEDVEDEPDEILYSFLEPGENL